jgi:predicted nucleotidyltransferase
MNDPPRCSGDDLAIAVRVAEAILAADGIRIRKIILFGSRARGDATPDSDLDLLVVTRETTPTQRREYRHRSTESAAVWRAGRAARDDR